MKGSILGGRSLFITGTDKKGKSVTRQGKAVRATDFLFSSDRIWGIERSVFFNGREK